jgi:hypothetical protein
LLVASIAFVSAACARAEPGAAAPAAPASEASVAPAAGSTPSASEPFKLIKGDVQKLYARELPPLPKSAFNVGTVSGEVESASPPSAEQDEKSTRLTFSLGTGSPIQCFVYPKAMNVGAQLLAIIKAIDKVDVRAAHPTDVAVVGEHAAVFMEVDYLAKTSTGAAVGEVKLMAYDHPITPLVCLHDEVGYNAAFKRVTAGLASSLKIAGRQLRIPEFVDISIERIEGHAVGFSRSAVMVGDDGKKVYIESSSSLVPRSGTDMLVEDELRVEKLDREGRSAEVLYTTKEGGEVSEDLVLKHASGNEYHYEGLHLGKKVAGVLKTKGSKGFPPFLEVKRGMRKLLAQDDKNAEMHIEEYHPNLDANAPVEVVYKPLSKADRTVTMRLGATQVTLTLDADGLAEKGEMPVGSAHLTMERVLVRGSL